MGEAVGTRGHPEAVCEPLSQEHKPRPPLGCQPPFAVKSDREVGGSG